MRFAAFPSLKMPAASRAETVLEEERGDSLSKLQTSCVEHISPARSEAITMYDGRRIRQDT
jgi:hypothetical protein